MAQPVHASRQTKYYQYDGKLPFVEMMLNMMVAMGILDKIPPQYMNNGYGRYGNQGRYGNMNNLLLRNALLKRGVSPMALSSMGMNPMGMGMSPFGMSSMGMNPLTMGMNPMSMNAMKLNRLGLNNMGLNKRGLNKLGLNNLGVNSLNLNQQSSPWAESPWESSPWDDALLDSFPSSSFTDEPFVDDDSFQYTYSDKPFSRPYNDRRSTRGYSPLAKYATSAASRQRRQNTSPLARSSGRYDDRFDAHFDDRRSEERRYEERGYADNNAYTQSPYANASPCVTELCGLGKYTHAPAYAHLPVLSDSPVLLDGLWLTDTGEMLGIKDHRFLWSDGDSRYLTGRMQASQDRLVASVDGKEMVMQFQYRVEQNQLMTQDQSGLVRVFTRIPVGGI